MQAINFREKIERVIDKLEKVKIERKEVPIHRALVLFVLNKVQEPVGKLKLQKLVFLAGMAGGIKQIAEEYIPYKFGMFSESIEQELGFLEANHYIICLLYTSPSPRDRG